MSSAFDNKILGETDELIMLDSSEDCSEAVLALTQQAKRSLDIFTHALDLRIYNSRATHDAVINLATRSRYSEIRIIIKDSSEVVKRGSRLIELHHRLNSKIHIRKPPIEFNDYAEEFVIVDEVGLLRRKVATRYEAELNFYDPNSCRQLLKFFDDCWNKSAPDSELRRLLL